MSSDYYKLLDKVDSPRDLKRLSEEELRRYCDELRHYIIEQCSVNPGHLASSLGAVELAAALHYVYDTPEDKIVWDVGHQTYPHKIITGRREAFRHKRQLGGISGFPRIQESKYDAFGTGHASTAISAALGMARAYHMQGEKRHVVAVVGDGALTGGMCYEALNDAGSAGVPLIVVLNDNTMSISPNVGALSGYLTNLRQSGVYRSMKRVLRDALRHIPLIGAPLARLLEWLRDALKSALINGKFFEALGLEYYGPIDGHDIARMRETFERAKQAEGPVLIHVVTQKGKGYIPAEDRPDQFHGVAPFYVEPASGTVSSGKLAAEHLAERAKTDGRIAVITAAMPDGTGMSAFAKIYPKRFFDVGIAEEHAVTMASGMALAGMRPFVCIYSTFLQRAYDQIMMDACLNRAPVVFLLDRAGLTGPDGETHQGIFDISYLSTIPNMTIMAPKNKWELSDMIKYAVDFSAPIAIRYPRGEAYDGLREYRAPIACGKSEWIYRSGQIALFALGAMVKTAEAVHERLKALGYESSLINARFAKPLDEDALLSAARHHDLIVTMEENVISGGMGEQVMRFYEEHNLSVRVLAIAIPDEYVEHGNVEILRREVGIDAETITERTIEAYEELHAQESGAERNDF